MMFNEQDRRDGVAAAYEEAVSDFGRLAEDEAPVVSDLGRSRLMHHGRRTARAYLLLHGTTNSPAQLLAFGGRLHALGHNVLIPRAPLHGLRSGHVSELGRLAPDALRGYGAGAARIGRGLGQELVLAGVSGGGTIAAWTALNEPQVRRTLLVAPFFALYGVPGGLSALFMRLLRRLPDRAFYRAGEAPRAWAYRGQSTRGIAAYDALAQEVRRRAGRGDAPAGEMLLLTTAADRVVNNAAIARVAAQWRGAGTAVRQYEFARALQIAHNTADPASDEQQRLLVYQKMLELLGEPPGE